MVELVQQIWGKGMKTTACCQGNPSPHDPKQHLKIYAYISFPTHEYILKFIGEYPIVEYIGVFDVLNCMEEMKIEITADDIMKHQPRSGDLYSVRFNNSYIQILTNYQ